MCLLRRASISCANAPHPMQCQAHLDLCTSLAVSDALTGHMLAHCSWSGVICSNCQLACSPHSHCQLDMPTAPQVCLDSGDGQGDDANYFRHTFSNIFPPVNGPVQKAIDAAFNFSVQTLPGGPSDRCMPQPDLLLQAQIAFISTLPDTVVLQTWSDADRRRRGTSRCGLRPRSPRTASRSTQL